MNTNRKWLRREAKKFAIEALCLLQLLYGYPLMALPEAEPHPNKAKEKSWISEVSTNLGQKAENLYTAAGKQAREGYKSFAYQPWQEAASILLTTGAYPPTGDRPTPTAPSLPPGASATPPRDFGKAIFESAANKAAVDQIPLFPGLQLISLPEEPDNTDPTAVLAGIGGSYDKVWTHDACDPQDPWTTFDPSDPAASNLTVLDHRKGIWISATSAVDLPSDGALPDATTIPLCTGWNLIGFPSAKPRHLRNALQSIEGKYVRLFGYELSTPERPWRGFDVNAPSWANDLEFLQPGRGYWILVTEDVTLEIKNVGDVPFVEFTTPQDLDVVTAPTDITGTVRSELLEAWTLSFRPVGDNEWQELTSQPFPVAEEGLVTFDPTLLLNGMYELRLQAIDLAGRVVEDTIVIVVEGSMKIGHFTLSFIDLAIPFSGLDIEVIRTYDSRNLEHNDFGHGWTLDIRQGSYRNNRPPGDGWQIPATTGPWGLPCSVVQESKSHLTTVRLSDREIYRFRLVLLNPSIVLGGCYAEAAFEWVDGPLPGTTLEILGDNQVFAANGSDTAVVPDTQEPFVPEDVRLTTRDGRIFHLDLVEGVTRLEDLNGNTLEITPEGISHSSGQGIDFERDAAGRIESITDPLGRQHVYRYNNEGDLETSIDRIGEATQFEYEPKHRLRRILNADGQELLKVQFTEDRVAQMCDGLNQCTNLTHDLPGRVETVLDATNRQITYRYNERGNVVEQTNALGHTYQFEYNERDQLIAHRDPLGNTARFTYDDFGNLQSTVEPHEEEQAAADFTTLFTFNDLNRMTSAQKPDGTRRFLDYDSSGNLLAVRDAEDNILQSWTYDTQGRQTSATERFGTEQYLDLHPSGEPRQAIDQDGQVINSTYDEMGNLLTLAIDGRSSQFTYDALGRETLAQYEGFQVSTSYHRTGLWSQINNSLVGPVEREEDLTGQLTAWRFAHEGSQIHTWDAAGRMTSLTDPTGDITRYEHDAAGQVNAVELPGSGRVEIERDVSGRVTKMTDALGHHIERTYTPSGRVATQRDALGNLWQYRNGPGWLETEDTLGRVERTEVGGDNEVLRIVHADGTEVLMEYLQGVPAGETREYPVKIVDEGGHQRSFTYNPLGQLETATDPGGSAWQYAYAPFGGQEFTTAPTGEVVSGFDYDALGRLLERSYADGGTYLFEYEAGPDPTKLTLPSGEEVNSTYDSSGRLVGINTSNSEDRAFSWDAAGRLTGTVDALGTTTYDYAPGGNLAALKHSDGSHVRYGYNEIGRLVEIGLRPPGEPDVEHVTRYGYDANGNVTSILDPRGGTTEVEYDAAQRPKFRKLPNGIETTWSYDLQDRVHELIHRDPDGNVIASYLYTRDSMGEPTQVQRHDGSTVLYSYDTSFRLSGEQHVSPNGAVVKNIETTYDAAGNRQDRTIDGTVYSDHYRPGFQLESVRRGEDVVEAYSWDSNGRISGWQRDDVTWNLTHDTFDQLTQATSTAGETWQYSYDASGRRTKINDGTTTTRLLVAPSHIDGLETVHFASASDGEWSGFVHWGPQPLLRFTNEGAEYYLEDGLNNVGGRWTVEGFKENRYSAYGEPLDPATESPYLGDFGFHGEWRDTATGLYHLRARHYDPHTGRFLTRDLAEPEIFEPESNHPYLFANANPLVFGDPTGLFTMVEVNVNLSAQNVFQTTRVTAVNQARDEATEKIGEVVTSVLSNMVTRMVGVQGGSFGALSSAITSATQLGNMFENFIVGMFCYAFEDIAGDFVWLEPGIRQQDGRPISSGYTCDQRPGTRGRPKRGERHPDFVFRDRPPTMNRGKKSFLIGEIKLGINTFYSTWKRKRSGQWRAIYQYAGKHVYPPQLVLLLAFNNGKRYHWKWLLEQIQVRRVAGVIISAR